MSPVTNQLASYISRIRTPSMYSHPPKLSNNLRSSPVNSPLGSYSLAWSMGSRVVSSIHLSLLCSLDAFNLPPPLSLPVGQAIICNLLSRFVRIQPVPPSSLFVTFIRYLNPSRYLTMYQPARRSACCYHLLFRLCPTWCLSTLSPPRFNSLPSLSFGHSFVPCALVP